MRSIFLFGLGLAMGCAFTAIALNALAQRSAYPRGVMQVMQHHYTGLRAGLRAGNCSGAAHEAEALRLLIEEVGPSVYGSANPEPPFREYNQRLHAAVDGLAGAPASDCAALAPIVERIGNACDACHRQYR